MTFEDQILALYQQHGHMHLVPFIGDAYHYPKPVDFRVVVLGINAYLSDKDYGKAPEDVGQWFRNWWRDAAHGKDTWPYYSTAYTESDGIARGLRTSPYFQGLHYVSDPAGKPCLYATNAIKEFLPEQHKDAATITTELLQPSTQTWHQELDLMAQYRVFPHLVVVFGKVIWEWIWKSFSPEYAPHYEHFQILEYCPCVSDKSPVFHRANRIRIALHKSEQTLLLVRLDHPATKRTKRKNAQWLLQQPDFLILAGISSGKEGPDSYENWRAARDKEEAEYAFEFPLFTDAFITGELNDGLGPYQLLNGMVFLEERRATVQPAIILRVFQHQKFILDVSPITESDVRNYHGGKLCDEIAALVSLCLGIRVKAGRPNRVFDLKKDPKGHPQYDGGIDPVRIFPPFYRYKIPAAVGTHCLSKANRMKEYIALEPDDASALIKSARLYQEAMWIAESAPSLSWLLFVSAIETLAQEKRKDPAKSKVEKLRLAKPWVVESLSAFGPEVVEIVAREFADTIKSTVKFIEFFLRFLPPPPEQRPPVHAQHPWTPEDLTKSLRTIYKHRSTALHGGTAFPLPMCVSPSVKTNDGFELWEKPFGATMRYGSTQWIEADAPMNLHIFEYIVRTVILAWWDSRVGEVTQG